MSSTDPEQEPGEANEHLTQSVVPEHMRDALTAAAERDSDRTAVMEQAQSLGLVGDGEAITVAEARERIARFEAEQQAEQARATIAGSGEGHQRQPMESRYTPGEIMPRLRPDSNPDDIRKTLEWYARQFEWDELTPRQAMQLLQDARTQGLYRRDRDTGERTPIAVADEDLRRRVVELFGEGTEEVGLGEQTYQRLEAERRQGRPDRAARPAEESDRTRFSREEAEGLVEMLRDEMGELGDAGSREEWREVLEDFLREKLFRYGDRGKIWNVTDEDLREQAKELFAEAERQYTVATSKAGIATTDAEWMGHERNERQAARTAGSAAGAPDSENQPRRLTLEVLRGRADALEGRINALSQNDQATWEQWRKILDDFFSENIGVLSYDDEAQGDDKGRAVSIARKSDARERALRLYRTAIKEFVAAEARAGIATTGRRSGVGGQAGESQPEVGSDEIRSRLDELEARFTDLSQGRATWEQWRRIRDDFLAQDWFEQERGAVGKDKSRGGSSISNRELRERAIRLYKSIRRAERVAAGRPYDLDQAQEDEMASQAHFNDFEDPSGLVEEELAREAGQGASRQSSEPFQFASQPMGVNGPQVAPEPIGVQVTQYTPEREPAEPEPQAAQAEGDTVGENVGGGEPEQAPAEDPLVTRAVERVRRGWQRAINLERDERQRRRMEGMMQDEIEFERDRITAELRLENERARRNSLRRPGA